MAYELIEQIEVGAGGASSIEFTSIPQDGVDLVCVWSLRNGSASQFVGAQIVFNSDTSVNYAFTGLLGDGSSVYAEANPANNRFDAYTATSLNTANTFSSGQIYISNYTSATSKSISMDNVTENNATTAYQELEAQRYTTTSPITAVRLSSGSDWVVGSTASLYKIS